MPRHYLTELRRRTCEAVKDLADVTHLVDRRSRWWSPSLATAPVRR
jgi:hypothetical protein